MSSSPGIELGKLGEAYAAAYLEQRGYRLVAANFTLPVGRNLRGAVVNNEIDLIAYDGALLHRSENTCFRLVRTAADQCRLTKTAAGCACCASLPPSVRTRRSTVSLRRRHSCVT